MIDGTNFQQGFRYVHFQRIFSSNKQEAVDLAFVDIPLTCHIEVQ